MLTLNGNAHLAQYIKATYSEYPGSWKPINAEQAKALFAEKAALVDKGDEYPLADALELFGWRVVFTVLEWGRNRPGTYFNAVGLNDVLQDMLTFFTQEGFMCAVSLENARVLLPAQLPINEQEHIDFAEFDAREEQRIQARKAAAKAKREAAKAKKEEAVNG